MFDVRLVEAKIQVFEFNHQYMDTFEFVQCSKIYVRVRLMFDEMVFDPSLNQSSNGIRTISSFQNCQSLSFEQL